MATEMFYWKFISFANFIMCAVVLRSRIYYYYVEIERKILRGEMERYN